MSPAEDQGANVAGQRADCPHAPHDYSCGPIHGGLCAMEHSGPCEAVHPICPACFTGNPRIVISSVALTVQRDGVRILSCSTCEKRAFRYDAELFCGTCGWLVPDVNEKLAERFAANGGPFGEEAPGVCPGCGQSGAGPAMTFPIACPGCGNGLMINQESVGKTAETHVLCKCSYPIVIPPDVWCPDCGLNLRGLTKIGQLVKEANEPRAKRGDNLRESPVDRIARQAIALAEAGERRSRGLPESKRRLMLDDQHLDMLLFNDGQIADWILDEVRLRSLGHRLNRDGGMQLMQAVAKRIAALDPAVLRLVDVNWDGIGEWRG